MSDIAEELRKWWRFDNYQHPLSSWHEREDFIAKILPQFETENMRLQELSQEARAVLDAVRNGKMTVQTSDVWPTVALPYGPSTIELFRAVAEAIYTLDARLTKLEQR